MVKIKGGTVNSKHERGITFDLWASSELSDVNSHTTKEWDGDLGTILGQEHIKFTVDKCSSCGFNRLNYLWKDSVFNQRNQNASNLGHERSSQGDVDIFRIDINLNSRSCNLWSKASFLAWLSRQSKWDVHAKAAIDEVNLHRSFNIEEKIFEFEVSFHLHVDSLCIKSDAIVRWHICDVDSFAIWNWETDGDVLEE